MKALVTGGAGFIGSHIVDELARNGFKVTVIDNLITGEKKNLNPKSKFIKLDIRSRKLTDVVLDVRPDFIYHLAAQIDVRKSVRDPVFDADVNILGSIRLLEAARRAEVKKFIFSSSGGAIYGGAKTIPTPENYRATPFSPYGSAKLSFEHYLNSFDHIYKFPFVSLRYANVYGPRQSSKGEAGVVAIFTSKLLNREVPLINGNGEQTRDYVYVGDVARANILAMKSKTSGFYNIGTGRETDVNEIFEILNKLTGGLAKTKHCPAKLGEEKRSAIDPSLAYKKLRWWPEVKLEDGLEMTVKWFRKRL